MTAARARKTTRDVPAGPSRLRVSLLARATVDRARAVLGAGRVAWLGERVEDADPDAERYLLDLELRVTDAAPRVAFHKAAFVDLGAAEARDGRVSLPISWRAAGMTPLFPVFVGRLTWADDELRLDGWYEPPGGNVGVVMDRLLLNVAARATGRRLLERVAEELAAD